MELNPINIENIEMKDDDLTHGALQQQNATRHNQQNAVFITDIEDVVNDASQQPVKKPLDKTRY